jgi:type I restriction enzyme, R subunit
MQKWPGMYESDFAIQVTSNVQKAQEYTTQFTYNTLRGQTKWLNEYDSSRARVCVTVGMMTTGYDCSDILNVCFMRPVFSPSDFIQMKGRGTRLHKFTYVDYENDEEVVTATKDYFHLIDFFAVCEYFNEKYDYSVPLSVPKKVTSTLVKDSGSGSSGGDGDLMDSATPAYGPVDIHKPDAMHTTDVNMVGHKGMVVDREMFSTFVKDVQSDQKLRKLDDDNRAIALDYFKNNVLEKPAYYMTLDKIRKYFKLDRKVTLGEALDIAMGRVEQPKTKTELIAEEFDECMTTKNLHDKLGSDTDLYYQAHRLFDSYITSTEVQESIDSGKYGELDTHGQISIDDISRLFSEGVAEPLLEYARDYVEIGKFRG